MELSDNQANTTPQSLVLNCCQASLIHILEPSNILLTFPNYLKSCFGNTSIYIYIYTFLHIYVMYYVEIAMQFMLHYDIPGARLTKAYDVTIQKYRNSHAKTENGKMHILRCMGSKFCAKFQRCPLKFHTKFWTHTPQNMHFTSYQKFDDLWYLRVMTS